MSEPDSKWTRDVRLTLDFSRPLGELLPLYEQAADLAVGRRPAPVWVQADMRDPFASEGAP